MFIIVVEHDDVGDDVDVAENFDIGVDNLLDLPVTQFHSTLCHLSHDVIDVGLFSW